MTGYYTHIGFFSRIRLPMLGSLRQLSGQSLSVESRCVVLGPRGGFILILTS